MGTGLHVVRTKEWLDAAKLPITKDEVARLVASDPDLEWSDASFAQFQAEPDAIARFSTTSRLGIKWKGSPCFWWDRGQIVCKNSDHVHTAKLIRMAESLHALVIGDAGERYILSIGQFGRAKVQVVQP
jgi:hypothetical protein